jgi:hypothetical protein
MRGLLELAPSVPLESSECPVGETACLVYLPCSSASSFSSLALLRSMVGKKKIFVEFLSTLVMKGPPGFPTSMSIPFPRVFYV